MILYSCSNNNASDTAFSQNDTSVTFPKSAITKVLDSMHHGFRTKNFKVMESFLTEDGLYLGTDPSEIWSKKQLSQYFDKNVKDTNNISYTILSRNILLGKNNNSAMAIEQYYLSTMSDKMMVRSISKLVNKDNVWKISFYSWNFIPRNEDIKKINEALK
ncbi:MAG: hypothetical protein NVSMB45_03550 [Ginsengibacter sp.]